MIIIINGEKKEVNAAITLQKLIKQIGYKKNTFAVAVNEKFVPRAQYKKIHLNDHDRIDIVTAMQGG